MKRILQTSVFLMLVFALILAGCGQQGASPTSKPAPANPTEPPLQTTAQPAEESSEPEEISEPIQPEPVALTVPELPLVDDYEFAEPPAGEAGGLQLGFLTWSDGSSVAVRAVQTNPGDALALPDQSGANSILQLDTDIGPGGWAGFSHAFSAETFDAWTPQDWSPYEGISLWLYGNNTGGSLFMDILDNRNPNSVGDDAERFTFNIADDFEGWQYFEIPFSDFIRKDIGNSAPNDGLTLSEVHGYAIGAFGSAAMGQQTNYVDQIMLYGDAGIRPVEVKFSEVYFSARESGIATIRLELNKPSEEPVTVEYYAIEGQAIPDRDFILPGDTVNFKPGERKQSFKVEIVDDAISEGNEQTLLVLTDPSGAVLNPQARAVLTIRDNDSLDSSILMDFDQAPPFIVDGEVTLSTLEITTNSDFTLPGQLDFENVLAVESQGAASFNRLYGESQDWSGNSGISFWFYGRNSGDTLTFELFDNHTTTTADVTPEDWQLIWSDEFDDPAGTRPNPNIWQPEIGDGLLNGLTGWGNGEFEYYTASPENAATDGEGNLVISAQQIEPDGANLLCWYGPCEYTSARLITWNRLEAEFGRVEARLRLPFGQGIWPAFWMLGIDLDEAGWPQSGEIDIMENIGREPTLTHGTLHGPGYSGGAGIGEGYDLESVNFSDDFHTFAIEWTPDQIRWFVDEINFFTMTPENIPAGTEWVYNHPFFIILNLAVGGNWPGSPDETSTFPQTMLVDYVRIYGAPSTAERYEYNFTDSAEGWTLMTIPFDSLARSASQPAGAPDDGLTLTEIWGYGFKLPPNASFYLDKIRLESE